MKYEGWSNSLGTGRSLLSFKEGDLNDIICIYTENEFQLTHLPPIFHFSTS